MRIIEIIKLAMKYNELLVKFTKGSIWLDDISVSWQKKESFLPRWEELLKEMDGILKQFESIGITFRDCESIEVIDIPDELKRPNVEIYLENNLQKTYAKKERKGMKLF